MRSVTGSASASARCSGCWKTSRTAPGLGADAMSIAQSGRVLAETSSPALALLVERFEADWRSSPVRRPNPRDYLPEEEEQRPAALLALLRAELALRWR